MSLLKWLGLSLSLFVSSSVAAADAVFIESIKATEGAELDCSKNKQLQLNIAGETFHINIIALKKTGRIRVDTTRSYLNEPQYQMEIKTEVTSTVKNTFFIKERQIMPALALDEFYQQQHRSDTEQLHIALEEAHSKGFCKNWDITSFQLITDKNTSE